MIEREWIVYALAWIVYYLLHSLLAGQFVKRCLSAFMARYYRLFYNIISLVGLAALVTWLVLSETPYLFKTTLGIQMLASLLLLSGLILTILALRQYNLSEFVGTSFIRKHTSPETEFSSLQVCGLNRYIRHPLYAAQYILTIGFFLMFPSQFMLVWLVITWIYLPIGMYLEEKKLLQHFGKAYADYRNKVPAILPFCKKCKSCCI